MERGIKYPRKRDLRSSTSGETVALGERVGTVGVRLFERIVWRCRFGDLGDCGDRGLAPSGT